jgi:hypothetical protein
MIASIQNPYPVIMDYASASLKDEIYSAVYS